MTINQVNFQLSPKQEEVMRCKAPRIVLSTGRRFGKSHFCRRWAQKHMFKGRYVDGCDLIDSPILYVAPTLGKAEKYMWRPLIRELEEMGVLADTRKKKLEIELVNGRQIWLASADNPDSLRGDSLAALIIDEMKDIKREAIEEAVLPALMDKDGPALFVGSPKKGTYFEELYRKGRSTRPQDDDWMSFEGTTYDNPMNKVEAIERYKRSVSDHIFQQEAMGKFVNAGNDYFNSDSWKVLSTTEFNSMTADTHRYMSIDLAGFTEDKTGKRDNHSIAIVAVNSRGWFVEDVIAGTWDPRTTAAKICMAYKTYNPLSIGIEGGAIKNTFMPGLLDYARKFGIYFEVDELMHGGKKKQDRIAMELLVRASQGRLYLKEAPWNRDVLEESEDFPNPLCHDDRLDSIAYTGQLAITDYNSGSIFDEEDEWQPADSFSGY